METIVKKLYEAMFLVDSTKAVEFEATIKAIKDILEKAKVEIVSIKKWDERKLAYKVKGAARGTYILVYFKADGSTITQIERDVQLSENILRVLILTAEHMTPEDLEKETPSAAVERQQQQAAKAAEEKAALRAEKAEQAEKAAKEAQAEKENNESDESDSDNKEEAKSDEPKDSGQKDSDVVEEPPVEEENKEEEKE
ncbi:MAG: 30S ribosomal protein S6 [Planctomycetes bacterium]|nr:30S ribosomal protein S6 [Planctomycetota bacterium]MCK5473394.1 30S ribosomal protein S6 [Planctomycetota bacterium]